MFPIGEQVTEDAGRKLAAWAAGGIAGVKGVTAEPSMTAVAGIERSTDFITADQHIHLTDLCKDFGIEQARLCKKAGVESIAKIPASKYQSSVAYLTELRQRQASA